ncbi:MAG TPA: molecular chaperone TorD family protein [Azospirillaceae bacterium]|nr:molecular chaperone TorD family protein [Azospirillaceae bacterium]
MGNVAVDEPDRLRAHVYALLAHLLARPPDAGLLALVAPLRGDDTLLGRALTALGKAASDIAERAAEREYSALFIGVVRGELVPYASYYRTGFLNERPLARVRIDMQALGIARAPGVPEPEDHIAALCEVMAGLILGTFGAPADLGHQQDFFDRHLAPWADRFFADLEAAEAAVLYRPVGTIGRVFLDIEAQAFALASTTQEMT